MLNFKPACHSKSKTNMFPCFFLTFPHVFRSVASKPRTPPSERQRRREKALIEEIRHSRLADIEDLIRLQGPLTEDAVLKTLQARFYNKKFQVGVRDIEKKDQCRRKGKGRLCGLGDRIYSLPCRASYCILH